MSNRDPIGHPEKAMMTLAKQLRSAAYWCRDGYYTSHEEALVNGAKREVLEEIAQAIDNAFEIDSTLSGEEMRR